MAMQITSWPPERREEARRLTQEHGIQKAARLMGYESDAALRGMFRHYGIEYRTLPAPTPVPVPAPPSGGVDVSDEPEFLRPPPELPVIPVGKEITASLVGDIHTPEEDKSAWSACLRWHAEVQPDVIVLNEVGEWRSMTHHGGNWGDMFAEDVKATHRKLVQVRSVCRNSRIVILETNHDTRIRRLISDLLPQLSGYLSLQKELHLDDLGIDWVPETVPFRLGRLKVIHGHQLASDARSGRVPENACKRAIQRFGEPGWTVVFFHTHRKGYWMERHDTGVLEAVNLPCLRTLAPDWTAPVPTGWQHGFGVAHIGPAGQTNLFCADIEHGSFVYGGQRFSAA